MPTKRTKKEKRRINMQIDIQWEVKEQTSLDYEKIIQDIVEEKSWLCFLSLWCFPLRKLYRVRGDAGIKSKPRGIDYATDVLSFPLLSLDPPGSFPESLEEEWGNFDPETGELMLGDIVLNWDKVKEQAESYGHSLERELAFLIAHSLLHLFLLWSHGGRGTKRNGAEAGRDIRE